MNEVRYGEVVLRRDYDTGDVEVETASPVALCSLAMLVGCDEDAARMVGPDRLLFGRPRPVEYRVVGWEPYRLALVIERVDG